MKDERSGTDALFSTRYPASFIRSEDLLPV
jgi:hypothetical protein